ncbi:MAG: hypothetical protein HY904_24245 [Deltaproteobacteria bacterium]|nr:hypothetical protein [Deltaproteobacteria bacterium]
MNNASRLAALALVVSATSAGAPVNDLKVFSIILSSSRDGELAPCG